MDHHHAHALGALWESPFDRALVLSYDGGGNDGSFFVYLGDRGSGNVTKLVEVEMNMGITYTAMGMLLPDVAGRHHPPKKQVLSQCDVCHTQPFWMVMSLPVAGKLMGYSALGQVHPHTDTDTHRDRDGDALDSGRMASCSTDGHRALGAARVGGANHGAVPRKGADAVQGTRLTAHSSMHTVHGNNDHAHTGGGAAVLARIVQMHRVGSALREAGRTPGAERGRRRLPLGPKRGAGHGRYQPTRLHTAGPRTNLAFLFPFLLFEVPLLSPSPVS